MSRITQKDMVLFTEIRNKVLERSNEVASILCGKSPYRDMIKSAKFSSQSIKILDTYIRINI